jgi:hypothetical protein
MSLKTLSHRLRIGASVLLLACAGTAQAGTFQLGPLPTFPLPYNVLVTHAPGNFTDYFYFEVGPRQSVSNTAVSLNLRFSAGLDFETSRLSLGFYDLSNSFYGVANGFGDPQTVALEQALQPGSYYSAVNGFASGSAGGTYAYSISAISAVPEPQIWWLMSVGFTAVGFMFYLRRR